MRIEDAEYWGAMALADSPPWGRGHGPLLMAVYERLLGTYGPQGWWPGDGGPFEVCVGAILTQSAAWTNVEKALDSMKRAGVLSPSGVRDTPVEELAPIVRPSGYFNAKAAKLKAFAAHLYARHGGDLDAMLGQPWEALREELLSVHGIGEETADDILLYAARRPSFVVDAYTRRVLSRLGVVPEGPGYRAWRALFMDALPRDTALYQEYHALLVRLGKGVCLKQAPRCQACPLRESCPTGGEAAGGRS